MLEDVYKYFEQKEQLEQEEIRKPSSIPSTNKQDSVRPCDHIHIVKPGDTLYQIANMHHVSVSDLLAKNPFVDVYNLQIGTELCIPNN